MSEVTRLVTAEESARLPDDGYGYELATTFRPGTPPVPLGSEGDILDLGDVISGFRCRLREIFL
jgi:hypothetical protein